MSRIPSSNVLGSSANTESTERPSDLREVDLDHFLQLLITELQNQDPLNPMDNAQILEQIGQIREIGATNQLTDSLNTMTTGQNLSTASGLIGKQISALSDQLEEVEGVVERVSLEVDEDTDARTLRVHVGEHNIQIKNIREILTPQSEAAEASPADDA